MITDQLDSSTGLPAITESRAAKRWRALPRSLSKLAEIHDANETGPWYPEHHTYKGHIIERVQCWKCGRDLKAWRLMVDRHGSYVMIQHNGEHFAMEWLPLPHLTMTPLAFYLPLLEQTVALNVLHCLDCKIAGAEALDALACQWAGIDSILQNAWNQGMATHVTPARWATYLYRWSQVEPRGVVTPEEMATMEKIPAAGELITAAQFILDMDLARRSALPKGVIVKFEGDQAPRGWTLIPDRAGYIEKL